MASVGPRPSRPEAGTAVAGEAELRAELERANRRYERERRIRMQAEAIAEQTTARLYEADRMKAVFLETVSHELRTPLTSINGFAEALTSHWDMVSEEDRKDYVGRILRNGHLLGALIEDILDFTHLGHQVAQLHPEPIALDETMPRLVEQLVIVLDGRPTRLDVADQPVVLADAVALQRILTNLLSNAVRYSPPGSTIDLAALRIGGQVAIEVVDRGPGVPESERAIVFEQFFRGSHISVPSTHGTGIGLAVVKQLVEAMGGTVGVDDAHGGGARFTVLLPAASAG